MATPVLLLPGGVLPASLAYADLVPALGPDVDARPKELELYAGDALPTNWGLGTEVEGISRYADDAGFDRFHLVGYSGGGAVSLAFCAAHPSRLLSLTLNEPAWAGNEGLSSDEQQIWRESDRIMALGPDELMRDFVRLELRHDVEPPPAPESPPPPWMAKRPAGLRMFLSAFKHYRLDVERLRSFEGPVLFVQGGKSNPKLYEGMIDRLRGIFRDFLVDVYEERHHFDPPHRAEPERFARSLKALWQRVDASAKN